MTDEFQRFQTALEAVPKILLGADASKMFKDAEDALVALQTATSDQTVVVIVGCSGVGKSYLFNAIAGLDISPSGVLRPTTKAAVAAGRQLWPESLANVKRVPLPDAPLGLIVVDTPPWDFDKEGVEELLRSADIAVLVVSPSRYGDSTTRELWQRVTRTDDVVLVVNRLPKSALARDEILESVSLRFGASPIAVIEGGDAEQFVLEVVERRPEDAEQDMKNVEVRQAAQKAGRTLATALTASAADLASLASTLNACELPKHTSDGSTVEESWLATHQAFMDTVANEIERMDADIVESSHASLAQRALSLIGEWDGAELNRDLERWRVAVADDFQAQAVVRWRRSSARRLLAETSWKLAADPTHTVAGRVSRMMKSNLADAVYRGNKSLVSVLSSPFAERLAAWHSVIDEAGQFKPGELLVASNRLLIS